MEECNRNELLLYKIDLTSLRELPWTRRPTTTKEIEFWLHYEIGTRSWLSASYYSYPASFHLAQRTAKASAYRILPLYTPFAFNCDRWRKRNFFFFFSLNLRPKNLHFGKISSRILKCAYDKKKKK